MNEVLLGTRVKGLTSLEANFAVTAVVFEE